MPKKQEQKHKNKSSVVTNIIKTLKMAHMKKKILKKKEYTPLTSSLWLTRSKLPLLKIK